MQTIASILTLTSLLTTVLTAPTARSLLPRAGGPISQPIDDCNLTSVYPTFPNWGLGSVPSSSFVSSSLLYSYVLNEAYQLTSSEEVLLNNCLETCHGYGNLNQCQSVFLAYDFPNIPTTGGMVLGTDEPSGEQVGCVLFSSPLGEEDLVEPAESGTYTSAKAVDITCPN